MSLGLEVYRGSPKMDTFFFFLHHFFIIAIILGVCGWALIQVCLSNSTTSSRDPAFLKKLRERSRYILINFQFFILLAFAGLNLTDGTEADSRLRFIAILIGFVSAIAYWGLTLFVAVYLVAPTTEKYLLPKLKKICEKNGR